jgi:WD40 repeat protein
MKPSTTKRFYKTVYENHDNEILGMFCLRSNELLSVDSGGGLKRLNLDTLISETLDLFGDNKNTVTCVMANEEGDALFFGLESGAIWMSDLSTSDELIYSHTKSITAIASAKSTVFTASQDLIIKMYNLKTQSVIANIPCSAVVNILQPLSNIFGLPLVISDLSGCVSIWSPHLLKTSSSSVQFCCQLSNKILSISQITLFHRSCIVCTTATLIAIYAIAVKKVNGRGEKEHISLLRDEIYSLVRTITPPQQSVQFMSCISMNYTPLPISNSSSASTPHSAVEMNLNSLLLSSCSDGFVYQWEPLTGQVMRKYQVTSDSTLPCLSLLYLPTYQMFAGTDVNNTLYLLNSSSTPLVTSLAIAGSAPPSSLKTIITCATVTDVHSTIIAYGDSSGQLHLSSNLVHQSHTPSSPLLTAATAIALVFLSASEELVLISGHSNGSLHFYICSIDGTLPSLDQARHQEITSVYSSMITAIQTLPSQTIATASESESVIIWNLNAKGLANKVAQLTASTQILSLISHPEGYLIGSDSTHQLHIWKTNENWKKIIPSSLTSDSSFSLTSPRAALISSTKQKIGLFHDRKRGVHYILTAFVSLNRAAGSDGGENKIKLFKIVNRSELLLDAIIELPIQCSDISFWSQGDSNLVFIQSAADRKISSINIHSYDTINSLSQSRDFISLDCLSHPQLIDCELVAVTGVSSPIVLTCETNSLTQNQTLQVWNNDLHDLDQFYSSSLLVALDPITNSLFSSEVSEEYLYRLIESHPCFPTSLLVPEITSTVSRSIFFTALLNGGGRSKGGTHSLTSDLLQRYLPKIPIAVTHSCSLPHPHSTKHSLLSLALHLQDISSVDLILSQWIALLQQSNSSPSETCRAQYHLMELFQDSQTLAELQPAKYSQFLQQLPLLVNHSVIQKNYTTHQSVSFSSPSSALLNLVGAGRSGVNDDVCMMRGTEYRVIPSFWSSVSENGKIGSAAVSGAYPDLMGRVLAPEDEEICWLPFEQPHDCKALQQIPTAGVEQHTPHTQQQRHKKLSTPAPKIVDQAAAEVAVEEKSDTIPQQANEVNSLTLSMNATQRKIEEGILVQSYVHPIPYAAAGTDFLSLCHTTHLLTGSQSPLLSSPLVASIIDYKWNSFFSKTYHSRVLHSLFLLILFTFHCIYFEELINSPSKTGLPSLAFIVSLCLLFNYFLLLIEVLLRLLTARSYSATLRDPWFYLGLSAYSAVVAGILMSLLSQHDGDLKRHTSFNARCVISAASLLLFMQFLYSLM